MAGHDRLIIFPSRANEVQIKQRIAAAKRGMGLLKRKRDAIDIKLRELKRLMAEKEEEVDYKMRNAIFSITKANLIGTDFNPAYVTDTHLATTTITKRQQKIVGITMHYFELEFSPVAAYPLTGLGCGGQHVQIVRTRFQEVLTDLVAFASLEYMVRMMMYASRQTNMRVNALDHVVIPRFINTHAYICGELEEFEREEFYRLKRSQVKQLEAKIAFTEIIRTKNMTPEELEAYLKRGTYAHPVADVHFDLDDFDRDNVEDRVRQARLQRHLKRMEEQEQAPEDIDAFLKRSSSFSPTPSMVEYMARAQVPYAAEIIAEAKKKKEEQKKRAVEMRKAAEKKNAEQRKRDEEKKDDEENDEPPQ
ncbi:V-type proton ATPase subunit D [Scaptodrosophila lebanonensis]|uniref:V-type proton ATPase subunit D n=1 Tax=Drosophila lebanonensis TaxID=7225 RepID=A0A6J2T0S2_DROLE|nr:V-type proton ATPase subunit D [Scaptodrosophila lebanonensis]